MQSKGECASWDMRMSMINAWMYFMCVNTILVVHEKSVYLSAFSFLYVKCEVYSAHAYL